MTKLETQYLEKLLGYLVRVGESSNEDFADNQWNLENFISNDLGQLKDIVKKRISLLRSVSK